MCNKQLSESELLNKQNPSGYYGEKISEGNVQDLNNILKFSESYLNKNVIIKGKVTEVCPMRGCWMQVKDDEFNLSIRTKVVDGEIVFPLSAKGRTATIEGVFTRLDLSEEQAINWKIHLAEEKGVILKPEDINLKPEDLFEYRINCIGAQIL